jgi:hypothetical protein
MGMWREADPVLNDANEVIKGGMWPHQRDWWNKPNFIKVLVMGYGGGKTMISGKRAIAMARHNRGVPYMYVSPSYKIAKRTIIPTLEEMFDGRKIRYKYNKSDFEFKIKGGGTIWIASGDDPKSLKGPNLCGANIDEPFIQDKEVFNQMLARVRDPKAKRREITMTGTPEDLNWGYDICEGEDRDRYDLGFIQASSRDNLALPPEYLETLTNAYDDRMVDAYVDGKFVNMSTGRIYYGFERGRNVQTIPMPQGAEVGLGQDFNVNPMAGALFWTKGRHMHFFKEIELPNSDTEQAIGVSLEEARKARGVLTTAYPDPSGKARKTSASAGQTDFTIIKSAGVQVKARFKAPPIRDRRNAVNKKLQMAEITIDPSCKRLIRYLEQLCHELLNKQESMTHLTDAVGYAIEYLYPIKKPIIQQGG